MNVNLVDLYLSTVKDYSTLAKNSISRSNIEIANTATFPKEDSLELFILELDKLLKSSSISKNELLELIEKFYPKLLKENSSKEKILKSLLKTISKDLKNNKENIIPILKEILNKNISKADRLLIVDFVNKSITENYNKDTDKIQSLLKTKADSILKTFSDGVPRKIDLKILDSKNSTIKVITPDSKTINIITNKIILTNTNISAITDGKGRVFIPSELMQSKLLNNNSKNQIIQKFLEKNNFSSKTTESKEKLKKELSILLKESPKLIDKISIDGSREEKLLSAVLKNNGDLKKTLIDNILGNNKSVSKDIDSILKYIDTISSKKDDTILQSNNSLAKILKLFIREGSLNSSVAKNITSIIEDASKLDSANDIKKSVKLSGLNFEKEVMQDLNKGSRKIVIKDIKGIAQLIKLLANSSADTTSVEQKTRVMDGVERILSSMETVQIKNELDKDNINIYLPIADTVKEDKRGVVLTFKRKEKINKNSADETTYIKIRSSPSKLGDTDILVELTNNVLWLDFVLDSSKWISTFWENINSLKTKLELLNYTVGKINIKENINAPQLPLFDKKDTYILQNGSIYFEG